MTHPSTSTTNAHGGVSDLAVSYQHVISYHIIM